jgi:hypothetical protein
MICVIFGVLACGSMSDDVGSNSDKEAVNILETKSNIGLTPEKFQAKYNEKVKTSESLRLTKLEFIDGSVNDVVIFKTAYKTQMIASVYKKSKLIEGITFSFKPTNSDEVIESLVVMGSVIIATNPDIPDKQVNDILTKIGVFDKNLDGLDKSIVINNINYSFTNIIDGLFIFTATPADE